MEIGMHIVELERPNNHKGTIEHRVTPDEGGFYGLVPGNVDETVNAKVALGAHSSLEDVEADIVDFLTTNYGEPGDFILAGRDPLSKITPWLEAWMPDVAELFSKDFHVDSSQFEFLFAAANPVLVPWVGQEEPAEPKPANVLAAEMCLQYMYCLEVLDTVPLTEE
jgi:hypothetical protein